MKAEVESDTSSREVRIAVTGGPELNITEPWHNRLRRIRVERISVRIVDGELRSVTASGPLLRIDGSASTSATDKHVWRKHGLRETEAFSAAPDWVQQLVSEATQGVSTWTVELAS